MENKILINGGNSLKGKIENQSSKNSILPILAAAILTDEKVVLNKICNLTDIENMLLILESLGVRILRENDKVEIDSSGINRFLIDEKLSKTLRASIFLLGPMLAKYKRVTISYPGGCDIGNRPIDLHLSGLKKLGVEIEERHSLIICNGKNMKSETIHLDFPSVGATENLIMASIFLKGKTKIINPAKEPEIVDLQNFLNSIGAKVSGAGSSEIVIEGVKSLKGTNYTAIGDRIVAGSYLIATAMCGGDITIANINPNHLSPLIDKLSQSGCLVDSFRNKVRLISNGKLKSVDLTETQVYPGFPTDLQAQFMAMQTVSEGVAVMVENIFENRYRHVPELCKMGANVLIKDKIAIVRGVDSLIGAPVEATDLRGGASLILAGLKAKGYTTISKIEHILRGYSNLDATLNKLGADVKFIEE